MTSPQTPPPEERERRVRSFVRRQGRMTDAQERAFDRHWRRFGIDMASAGMENQPSREIDFAKIFGRLSPLVLEIGTGNGEQLLFAATHDPARDHIGVEVHRPGVGRLLNDAAAADVTNLRIFCHDAVEVLRDGIADGALDEVRIYFPDPWPKSRQKKRRLVQPDFIALVVRKLRPGGRLHLATDWQDYAEQMLAVADAEPALRNRAGAGHFSECPPWRRETHFERRGRALGHGVWDLVHDRI